MTFLLNLDNFECHFLSSSTPDVLTSPRSLQACQSLGIQPVELLYRSLETYEESLGDLRLSQIYQLFELEETERQSKLLKCRELRNAMIAKRDAIWRKRERASTAATTSVQNERKRIPDFGGSDSEVNYGSETESHEDYWPAGKVSEVKGQERRSIKMTPKFKSSSNTDFKKLTNRPPHHICSCHMTLNEDQILGDYMHRFSDVLTSKNELSREDKKILELMILRKGKDAEWSKKCQELRQVIEHDKIAQLKRHQLKVETWAERLAEKRRLANMENTKRYLLLDQEAKERRTNLLNFLELRDSKVQQYLNQMHYQKQNQVLEHHKHEAMRQLEVSRTVERILEQDRLHRAELAEKLERQMVDSEKRRKRKEQDDLRHIAEMNRLEDVKRQLKQERLEQEAIRGTEALRNQIEEKEHRATINYLAKLRLRNTLLSHGVSSRNLAIDRTRRAHTELLHGLDEWNHKVYELHLASQQRANLNHLAEMHRRRARVVTDRLLREERTGEVQRRVREMQDQRIALMKAVIESKNFRSDQLKEQKEQQMYISRLRAQHCAEIRENLKEKLYPETFDRKAARADIESRLFHKYHPVTNHLLPRRHSVCKCKCRCPQLRDRTTLAYGCRQLK